MSERTFFTLCYALPGYTFILIVVLVAYPQLDEIFFQKEQVALVAAFLTFLSLLGGGALGFLVSQVWYVFFNLFIEANYEKFPDMIQDLTGKYRLNEDRGHRYHRIVFTDYVYRLNENKDLRYIEQRRYDLMHLSGSTLFSTIIGSFFGLLIRSGLFFTKITLEEAIDSLSNISIDMTKLKPLIIWTYDVGVILIVIILVILLFLTLRHAMKLHAISFEIAVNEVVNSGEFLPDKARKVFPPHYFRKEKGSHRSKRK